MPPDPFAALGIQPPSAAPPPPAAPQGGPNAFGALGIDTSQNFAPTPPPAKVGKGVGQNFAAGANRTIFGALGAPVDLATRAINDITANPISGYKGIIGPQPVGGSTWLEQQWGRLTGTNPESVQPVNEPERIAAATGGAIAQIPIMGAGGAALEGASTAPAVQSVGRALQQSSGLPAVAPVATGAAVGQASEDAAPEPLKPIANLAGNLAGAFGVAGLEAGATATGRQIKRQAGLIGLGSKEAIGGINATGAQMQNAANQVQDALGPGGGSRLSASLDAEQQARALEATLADPNATAAVKQQAQAQLDQIQASRANLVPGSEPTTAQVAQTPGAAALEKAHRVAAPEPFLAREQQQNSARLTAVQGMAPTNAQPSAVGDLFRQQLAALDTAGQQAVTQAQGGVRAATDTLGGTQPTAAYGDQARAALQAAQEPVHAATQRLWAAVDPDGTWALPATGARDAAAKLVGEISPTAQTDAQETALLQRAAQLPDVVRFRDLGDMRADTNAALMRLSGTPGYQPNVRRLTILKQSIDQSISDALEGRAAQEAQAVAAGQMAPEQTAEAALHRQVNDWYAARNAATASQAGTGGNSGANLRSSPTGGSSATAGLSGAESQAERGFGSASGTPGLPSQAQPLEANLTPEHAAAYRAAVGATRAEKQTFGQGGVGQVLRPGKQGADFAVQSGAVPAKIFTRGPTEPQEVQRFINAVGGPEHAAQIGRETLANELRQSGIIKLDGTLDASRFATWQARRQATIQQFPGLSDQFSNAATAQRTLDDVTAAHQAALKDFQNSAAAKFINADPQKAVASAFGSANPTATFTQLVRQVRGNADAEAGLKRAVVDYITEKTRSATPAGQGEDFQKAATFRNFIRQNNGALKALFGGQGVQNLDMVAADLRRQAQRASATAGSDTAANIAAARHHGLKETGFHATALAVIGEQMGEIISHAMGGNGMLGQVAGAALGGGGYLLHAMRQSGIATINDLVREAMLHPSVARELMARAQNGQIGPVAAQRIARALQGTLTANAAQQQEKQ